MQNFLIIELIGSLWVKTAGLSPTSGNSFYIEVIDSFVTYQ